MSVTELIRSRRAQHAIDRLYERYNILFNSDQIDWICQKIRENVNDRDFKLVTRGIDSKEIWKVNIGLLLEDDLWIYCVYDSFRSHVVTVLSWDQGRQASKRMHKHRIRMEERKRRSEAYEANNRLVLEYYYKKMGRPLQWPALN